MQKTSKKAIAIMVSLCLLLGSVGFAPGDVTTGSPLSKAAVKESKNSEFVTKIHDAAKAAGKTVSVKLTNIPASGVGSSDEGYASLSYTKEYKKVFNKEEYTEERTQVALVDRNGKMVFPYTHTDGKVYAYRDGIVSYGSADINNSWSCNINGKKDYCKYYDITGKELFTSELTDTGIATKSGIASCSQIYDNTGKLLYSIPEDLLQHSEWDDGGGTFFNVNGLPDIDYNWASFFVSLGLFNDGLIPFKCSVKMDGSLKNPDLRGTKWETKYEGDDEPSYDYYRYFVENMIRDGKTSGYMDTSGNIVIPQSFGNCGPFCEGLAWVISPESVKTPEVDTSNEEWYYNVTNYNNFLGLFDLKEAKVGFIDKNGELVIPYKYEATGAFHNGSAYVKKDGKYGYINSKDETLIPFEYDRAYGAENGLYSVGNQGKYGIVDSENKEVIPMIFDDISAPTDGVVYGVYDGKLVIMNFGEDEQSDWDNSGKKESYQSQFIKVLTTQKTIKQTKLKKNSQSFMIKGSAATKISYKKKTGDKRIKVSSSGKITLKKGMKKKKYKLKVIATAKDNGIFKSASITKTITIEVK